MAVGTPEGLYDLIAERRVNFTFQPDVPTKLTLARLKDETCENYLIANVGQRLVVTRADAVDAKESCAIVVFSHPGNNGPVPYPTCHAHAADALDEFDLLVGLSNGEIEVMSLRSQLRAGGASARPSASLTLNVDGSINASRCVAAAWVPGTRGQSFITAHRDGGVYLHQKMVGSSSDSALLARSGSHQSLAPPVRQIQGPGGGAGITAAAPSPQGTHLAVACKDGVLRIYELSTTQLVAGFKSYYGGLLCCAWTPDGEYVAAGGEDDLVSVYGMAERCLVAVGRGHSSWVSQVAFDPWLSHAIEAAAPAPTSPTGAIGAAEGGTLGVDASPMHVEPGTPGCGPGGGTIYRLASVGQDCQLCLWDVEVTEDSLAAGPCALSPTESKGFLQKQPPSPGHLVVREARGSGGGGAGRLPACITPSITKAEMPVMPVSAQQRIHWEPMSDVLFTPAAMVTACHGANVKVWARPSVEGMQN